MGFMAKTIGGIHPAVITFALGIVMSEIVDEHEEVEQNSKELFSVFWRPHSSFMQVCNSTFGL